MTSSRAARAVIAVSSALMVGFVLLWLPVSRLDVGRSDFTAFYVGGTLLREGHAGDLYSEPLQVALHDRLIAPDREGNLPFVDSPVAAALVLPVTLLPLDIAYRVWSLLEIGVLLLAVIVAVRSAPWPHATPRAWKVAAAAAAMASMGTWTVLLQAQWTPLLAAGLALAYRDWRREHHARGAAVLVLAAGIAKPHLAFGLLAFMLGWRQRRVIAGACAGAAALVAASLALVGLRGIAGFVAIAAGSTTRWDLRTMLSFVGLPGSFLGNGVAAHVIGALGSLAACAVAVRLGALVRRDRTRLDAALAAAAVLSLLAAPHAYPHDLVMLAPVAAWSVALALRGGVAADALGRSGPRLALTLGTWALISITAFVDFAGNAAVPPGQLAAWALLLASGVAAAEAWRGRPQRASAPQLSFSARAT